MALGDRGAALCNWRWGDKRDPCGLSRDLRRGEGSDRPLREVVEPGGRRGGHGACGRSRPDRTPATRAPLRTREGPGGRGGARVPRQHRACSQGSAPREGSAAAEEPPGRPDSLQRSARVTFSG